jgi:hypothetical protein
MDKRESKQALTWQALGGHQLTDYERDDIQTRLDALQSRKHKTLQHYRAIDILEARLDTGPGGQ